MNPPAPANPAPASPPAAPAPASGGLTRRRKLLLAAEAAGIAGILVFAWMRPTAEALWRWQVRAIGEAIAARYTPGMTADERIGVHAAVRRELTSMGRAANASAQVNEGLVQYWEGVGPSLFPLRKHVQPRYSRGKPRHHAAFWIGMQIDQHAALARTFIWHQDETGIFPPAWFFEAEFGGPIPETAAPGTKKPD